MIFITVGSQKFQFDRLLIKMEELLNEKIITEEVFAQIGVSNYKPKNYQFKNFLERGEFNEMVDKCEILITHGGTGTIINAVKKRKKVIAIPRLKKYEEHVDDHQIQLLQQFKELGMIEVCENLNDLGEIINTIKLREFKEYESNTNVIIESIEEFLSVNFKTIN